MANSDNRISFSYSELDTGNLIHPPPGMPHPVSPVS